MGLPWFLSNKGYSCIVIVYTLRLYIILFLFILEISSSFMPQLPSLSTNDIYRCNSKLTSFYVVNMTDPFTFTVQMDSALSK